MQALLYWFRRSAWLLRMKRTYFAAIRRRRLLRLVHDLDNYLTQVDVRAELPEARRVLVLAPHPNDDAIGCGGTLAQLAARGAEIDAVYMTDRAINGNEDSAAKYDAEVADAGKILGLASMTFFGGVDGDLHLMPGLAARLAAMLAETRYDLIFCPWAHDGHSDHAATFRILQNALPYADGVPDIWLYEVWTPLVANRAISIDKTLTVKSRAIKAHASQNTIDFAQKIAALAQYRSLLCPDSEHAEAFLCIDAAAMRDFRRKAA